MATAMEKKKKVFGNFIQFGIQKCCRIKLKAVWRSQNYLPFTFSLE